MNETFPRRRFGQNFLVREDLAARIVDLLAPRPGEAIVEIGPGRGALTSLAVVAAGRLAAVEIDRDLAAALRASFPADRLVVVEADILSVPLHDLAARLGVGPGERLALLGNLPYNISKPVASKLVAERDAVDRAVLMFQREVAARLTAREGSRDYGPLSVLVAFAYDVERVFDLPPGAFRPRPKVVSSVTRWRRSTTRDLPAPLEAPLRAVLRACFAMRRRTLLSNLRAALPGGEGAARALLREVGIEASLRAEALPPEAFGAMAARWPS